MTFTPSPPALGPPSAADLLRFGRSSPLAGALSDPHLSLLATSAARLVSSALEPGTAAKYARDIARVQRCAPDLLPMASTPLVMLYFASLQGGHWAAVSAARSAISEWHRARLLLPPPFTSPHLTAFWRGLQKSCINRVQGASPLPKHTLVALLRHWCSLLTLAALRNAFIAVVQFYGMRRISEVLALCRNSLSPGPGGQGFVLSIARQKNDPFGRGMDVALPECTSDPPVPVGSIIRSFLAATSFLPPHLPLVRPTVPGGRVWGVGTFSRNAWNQILYQTLALLAPADSASLRLSSHSLRKGGATAAVQAGLPHDVLVDTAGWNSSHSWLSYAQRPLAARQAALASL